MPIDFDVSKYNNKYFVETGTFTNKSVRKALDAGFEKVISVDIQKKFVERARKELSEHVESGRFKVYHGDSVDALKENILPELDAPATFWLDAHVDGSGGLSPSDVDEEMRCRLYEELEAIRNHSIKDHTIMIDDIRDVKSSSWRRSDINLEGLKKRLLQINGDYEFCFEDGYIEDDILIAREQK